MEQVKWRSACLGFDHTVYLKGDDRVGRGRSTYGQLGDRTTTDKSNPVQVKNADGTGLNGVVGISAGSSHTPCI